MTECCLLPLVGGGHTKVDPDIFAFASRWKWRRFGKGYVGRGIYVRGRGCYTVGYLHRIILDAKAGETVDHINGDRLDNRRANLRIADSSQQGQNQHKPRKSKTGFRNVYLTDSDTYLVKVFVRGRNIHIGCFSSLDEARAAAVLARQTHMTHSPENSGGTT